jgi:hypothetical protein
VEYVLVLSSSQFDSGPDQPHETGAREQYGPFEFVPPEYRRLDHGKRAPHWKAIFPRWRKCWVADIYFPIDGTIASGIVCPGLDQGASE